MNKKMDRKMYSSGQFAKKARVTLRTIRFYDSKGLLTPSAHTESGARLYTDEDLAKLQQILLFKYLGFSLDEIRELTVGVTEPAFLMDSLSIQKKLVREKIEELKEVEKALGEASSLVMKRETPDWNQMLHLIHLTSMERRLKEQYENESNISARIRLHAEYSVNQEGWFPWVYRQLELREDMQVLEVGCGNGELWVKNTSKLTELLHRSIMLTDISPGILRDAKNRMKELDGFDFQLADCEKLPFDDESFDLVVANHVLFYCENVEQALSECCRVLKKGGRLIAATYGPKHMMEITKLVQKFHPDIILSNEVLYDRFGLQNGEELLKPYFSKVEIRMYEDEIRISESEPLIAYILSCHGNQNQVIMNRYVEFRNFIQRKIKNGFHITKDAGVFVCEKEN